MLTLESAWNNYRKIFYHNVKNKQLLAELKKAFFTGMSVMFTALVENADDDEEKSMLFMERTQKDVQRFGAEIDKEFFEKIYSDKSTKH